MNRRGFLSGLGALIGGIALQEAIPLGRVWSFPKEVKCLNADKTYTSYLMGQDAIFNSLATVYYDKAVLDVLENNFRFYAAEKLYWEGTRIKRTMIPVSEFYKSA